MRDCLLALLLCGAALGADRPNVVIFLADDMGWGDLSVQGNRNLQTPHIDSLARDGASLENFYVCAVCAPTRAEFLTGRYHPRTGVRGVSEGQGRLNPEETTLADVFQEAGYATGAFGKWHNGTQPPYHPCDRGFEEFYGFTSGHWGHYFSPPLDHNRRRVRGDGFLVDDVTDHALEFIAQHRDTPFLCYVPFNTPHSPMMVPDRFYDRFDGRKLSQRHTDPDKEDPLMSRAALALCENLDWNVGRVLQQLRRLQLTDRTIVLFFSDNGPNSWRWNGGMKGRKGTIDEGGLRSACFWKWPGRIPARRVVTGTAGAIDLLPTLCGLAQLPVPEERRIDGVDLSAVIRGRREQSADRLLYSIWRNRVSVRSQRFRLDAGGHLFDITVDRGQQNDVAGKFPKVATRLQSAAETFRQQMAVEFQRSRERPFTVGYGPFTTLPARDGIAHGNIRRSSKAPNNSFFVNWTSADDHISWHVDIGQSGQYEVILHYTCRADDVGCRICLQDERGPSVAADITTAFDPPLYDKSKERVEKSHYFVKDFRPLRVGRFHLDSGETTLQLRAERLVGERAIDVHSIDINLLTPIKKD
ncbi:MAG: arylsulfatase [Planctomycetaceae bacterium]|nr:arylsulfatase [Planctomycetaceae bacterium]